jgi:hypothetical protein
LGSKSNALLLGLVVEYVQVVRHRIKAEEESVQQRHNIAKTARVISEMEAEIHDLFIANIDKDGKPMVPRCLDIQNYTMGYVSLVR